MRDRRGGHVSGDTPVTRDDLPKVPAGPGMGAALSMFKAACRSQDLTADALRDLKKAESERDEALGLLRELVAWAEDENASDGTSLWNRASALVNRSA